MRKSSSGPLVEVDVRPVCIKQELYTTGLRQVFSNLILRLYQYKNITQIQFSLDVDLVYNDQKCQEGLYSADFFKILLQPSISKWFQISKMSNILDGGKRMNLI